MDWNLAPDILSSTWLERLAAFAGVLLLSLGTWLIAVRVGRRLKGSTRLGLRSLERMAAPFSLLILALGSWFVVRPITPRPPIFSWAIEFLLVFGLFWFVARGLDVALATGRRSARVRSDLISDAALVLTHHVIKALVYFGLLIVLAVHMGITEQLYLVIGALGAALVFAARDPIRNVFAFALLVLEQPFQLGDWVVIGDYRGGDEIRGKVIDINLSSTTIRTRRRTLVYLTHSVLLGLRLENLSAASRRRLELTLPIPPGMTAEAIRNLCDAIEDELADRPKVSKRRKPRVWLSGFGRGLRLRLSLWLKPRINRREAQRDMLILAQEKLDEYLRQQRYIRR